MEVKLAKRYPVPASAARAWAVLGDVRATAACMPGANITEQVDDTHYKGTVKSRVGPAVMSFNGEIEVLARDAEAQTVQLLGKGADKAGSSASMNLSAAVEAGDTPDSSVLVGNATIIVSGKLAQFGSRLLVPVSDAMLKQFADNFGKAAAAAAAPVPAVSSVTTEPSPVIEPSTATAAATPAAAPTVALAAGGNAAPVLAPPPAPASVPAPAPAPQPANELNAAGLLWTVIKGWFANLFGGKR
ncbi:MAG: SRPBCC family protein [Rubrivivax sp.]